jgi:hypothetical protein
MIYFVGIEGLALIGASSAATSATSIPGSHLPASAHRAVISRSQRRALSKIKSATASVQSAFQKRDIDCDLRQVGEA